MNDGRGYIAVKDMEKYRNAFDYFDLCIFADYFNANLALRGHMGSRKNMAFH